MQEGIQPDGCGSGWQDNLDGMIELSEGGLTQAGITKSEQQFDGVSLDYLGRINNIPTENSGNVQNFVTNVSIITLMILTKIVSETDTFFQSLISQAECSSYFKKCSLHTRIAMRGEHYVDWLGKGKANLYSTLRSAASVGTCWIGIQ